MADNVQGIKIKKSPSTKLFFVICYIVVTAVALVCLLPFIMLVSGSFSSEHAIQTQGYGTFSDALTKEKIGGKNLM